MTQNTPQQSTPQHFSQEWPDADARVDPPRADGERETLLAFLDWHRETFALKCAGLSPEQLSAKAVEPSGLSLHGILRHLAGVERWWLQRQFAGHREVPLLYYTDEDPNQDFDDLAGDPAEVLAVWRTQCARSREIVAATPSLEATGTSEHGQTISLRWVLLHMIAEYARHNGHADLLRERLDGVTGF
jgi:uncharacterized damage-inducible protein DinB